MKLLLLTDTHCHLDTHLPGDGSHLHPPDGQLLRHLPQSGWSEHLFHSSQCRGFEQARGVRRRRTRAYRGQKADRAQQKFRDGGFSNLRVPGQCERQRRLEEVFFSVPAQFCPALPSLNRG
jgi:hypothetical protein